MTPTDTGRKRLRVKTGCQTCRARHVKCDERKPTCRHCGRKGRACTYDRIPEESKISLGTKPADFPQPREVTEKNAFFPTTDGLLESGDKSVIGIDHCNSTTKGYNELDNRRSSQSNAVTPTPSQASPSTNLASIFSVADWESQLVEPKLASSTFRQSAPIPLKGIEVAVFRNYVDRVSRWLDAFSRDAPFSSLVPRLAMYCPVLLHSILAYSARQMVLTAHNSSTRQYERLSVYHYRTALKALGNLLVNVESAGSDELLASSMILSSYEMLETIGDSFGSHLKGLAALLQAQSVRGDDFGVRGSVFWAWYRHETWSCLLTERKMTLDEQYWEPSIVTGFEKMTQEEIANRVTFIFGQVIDFCNHNTTSLDAGQLEARRDNAATLDAALADWKKKLPSWMLPLEIEPNIVSPSTGMKYPYRQNTPSLWFIYPQSAVAHQVYHATQILLALHRPQDDNHAHGLGRLASLATRRHIERSREQVCRVSNLGIPEEWGFPSSQCLFIAGLVTEGKEERQNTLNLIEECQRISGRGTVRMADELRKFWQLGE